jgi:putative endonuclease
MERTFHVYFMASQSGVLYLGVTGHLSKRVYQHQQKLIPGFTQKYNCTKLVWFEPHSTAALRSPAKRKSSVGTVRRKSPCSNL